MSGLVTGIVLDRYPNGGGERLVAIALADNAHRDGTNIYPSVGEVADRTKLSKRAVQLHMARMVASGWLVLTHKSTGRRGDTNQYRISPEWLAGGECVPPVEPVVRTNVKGLSGANIAPHGTVDNSSHGHGWGEAGDKVGCNLERPGVKRASPKPSGTVKEPLTPLTPRSTGGTVEKSEQPESSSPEGSKDRARWRWADKRSGIEARGEQLRVAPWDRRPLSDGGEPFVAYAARVLASHLATVGVARSPGLVRKALEGSGNWSEVLRSLATPQPSREAGP